MVNWKMEKLMMKELVLKKRERQLQRSMEKKTKRRKRRRRKSETKTRREMTKLTGTLGRSIGAPGKNLRGGQRGGDEKGRK